MSAWGKGWGQDKGLPLPVSWWHPAAPASQAWAASSLQLQGLCP